MLAQQIIVTQFIEKAMKVNANQLFFTVGRPVTYRNKNGELAELDSSNSFPLTADNMNSIIDQVVKNQKDRDILNNLGEIETVLSAHGRMRSRVNVFLQRGTYAMTITILTVNVKSIKPIDSYDLNLQPILTKPNGGGLCLITGHGDTISLAASLVDFYNTEYSLNILTVEDSISTLHRHKASTVNQRELPQNDTAPNSIIRIKNHGVDVLMLSSNRNESFFNEIMHLAISDIFIIATFGRSSLESLAKSLFSGLDAHNADELTERLTKYLRLAVAIDTNVTATELPPPGLPLC